MIFNKIKTKNRIFLSFLLAVFCSTATAIETDALVYAKETQTPFAPNAGAPTTSLDTGLAISDKTGYILIWGFRGSGQQGNGQSVVSISADPAPVNTFVSQKLRVVTAAGGAYHFIALDETGDLWGWGLNNYYQVGCNSSTGATSSPCKLLSNIVQVAAGEYVSYALNKNGEVYAWGAGLYGQRGDGSTTQLREGIRKVNLPEKIRLLGGAYEGGYAIGFSGTIYAWGDNEDCAFGYALSYNNCKGHDYISSPRPLIASSINGNDVVYIAGGDGHTTMLLENGDVYGIGRGASIGKGTTDTTAYNSATPYLIMRNVQSLYTRYVGSVALTDKREIYTWGQTGGSAFPTIYGPSPTKRVPVGLDADEYVVKIEGGKEHFYYTTNKGKIFGVGYGASHKLDQHSGVNRAWPGVRMTFLENAMKKYQ